MPLIRKGLPRVKANENTLKGTGNHRYISTLAQMSGEKCEADAKDNVCCMLIVSLVDHDC